ncbi:MAG: hypothetical protein K2O76_00715, partial [Mailhella sp.]|nr:hypothetical protein [Mailhella sp.]
GRDDTVGGLFCHRWLLSLGAKEGFPALQAFCKKHAVEHFHALGAVTNGAVTFNRQIAEEAGFDHFQ